jgi:hypothetical protein
MALSFPLSLYTNRHGISFLSAVAEHLLQNRRQLLTLRPFARSIL